MLVGQHRRQIGQRDRAVGPQLQRVAQHTLGLAQVAVMTVDDAERVVGVREGRSPPGSPPAPTSRRARRRRQRASPPRGCSSTSPPPSSPGSHGCGAPRPARSARSRWSGASNELSWSFTPCPGESSIRLTWSLRKAMPFTRLQVSAPVDVAVLQRNPQILGERGGQDHQRQAIARARIEGSARCASARVVGRWSARSRTTLNSALRGPTS